MVQVTHININLIKNERKNVLFSVPHYEIWLMILHSIIFPYVLDNLVSWERYERERDALADKVAAADTEFGNTVRVYNLEGGPADHAERVKTAASMRKDIEGCFKAMTDANDVLCQLLDEGKKAELAEEVRILHFVLWRPGLKARGLTQECTTMECLVSQARPAVTWKFCTSGPIKL